MAERTTAVAAWESLFRAQVSVMRSLNAEFPTGELSINEYDVLFNLSQQSDCGLRIRDLGEHLLLTQPSVSRLIDRLVARGFVAKSTDPGDARGVLVSLTDEGFDVFRRVALIHIRSITRRMSALDQAELDALARITAKLHRPQA